MKRFFSYLTLAITFAVAGVLPSAAQGYERDVARKTAVPQKGSYLLQVPFEFALQNKSEFEMLTLEASATSGKWFYVGNYKAMGTPSPKKYDGAYRDVDSWAFLPGAVFTKADNNYELAFEQFGNMAVGYSRVEVWIGTSASAAGMVTKIGTVDNFQNNMNKDPAVKQKFSFGLPGGVAGTYYIGFHCTTTAEQDGWSYINNISVGETASSAAAPATVTDAVVKAGEKGALKASVSFRMPTVDMGNKALPADKKLTAVVKSEVDTKSVEALPGADVSLDVATKQGDNRITVQVNNEKEGSPYEYSVYTGEVLPMRIHNLKGVLSRDNMTYTLTWTAPDKGENDGYVDFADLDYDIYQYDDQKQDYTYLTTVGKALTYTYTLAAGEKLRTVRLAVFARNAAGTSTDRMNWVDQDRVYVADMVGEPYTLPVIEEFDNQQIKYTPIRIMYPNEDYRGRWTIQDPGEILPDANQSALMGWDPLTEDPTMGRAAIAKFSTLGKSAQAFSVRLLKYIGYSSKMTFYVADYDTDPDNPCKIGEVDCNEGNETAWADYTFPIPEKFMNKEWIQIIVDAQYDEYNYMYAIDRYCIAGIHGKDLSVVGVTGPQALEISSTGEYTAEVYNIGTNTAAAKGQFEVVYDGTTIARTQTVDNQTIASGDKYTFSYKYTPLADDYGKNVTIRFTLTGGDEDATNDAAEQQVEVRLAETPVVTTLEASPAGGGVELSWQLPALNKTLVAAFDDEEAFSYGATIDGFTNYDGDGKTVCKFNSLTMPNEALPKAFMVVNPEQIGAADLDAHSGSQYLMAICPDMENGAYPAADDWLISPEVKGGSVFSFWMDIINEKYPESVRVKVSTTDAQPESFVAIDGGSILKVKKGWQKYEYVLPEDAKYVAVNYISQDKFGILVDDIKYVSATDLYAVKAYNIYRNGTKTGTTGDEATSGCSYSDTGLDAGTYAYQIAVVTADGEEHALSNTATVTLDPTGLDGIDADGGVAVKDSYLVDGMRTEGLQKGLNILRMTDGTVKKVVRK